MPRPPPMHIAGLILSLPSRSASPQINKKRAHIQLLIGISTGPQTQSWRYSSCSYSKRCRDEETSGCAGTNLPLLFFSIATQPSPTYSVSTRDTVTEWRVRPLVFQLWADISDVDDWWRFFFLLLFQVASEQLPDAVKPLWADPPSARKWVIKRYRPPPLAYCRGILFVLLSHFIRVKLHLRSFIAFHVPNCWYPGHHSL